MKNLDIARYRRQIMLGEIGQQKQQSLFDAKVSVIGAGGLGSPALLYLAGAGVGHIHIIDDDLVDLSNLHRQVIHTTAGVGTPKAESAREAMLALNPSVKVTVSVRRLDWSNALSELADSDVILDGSDNFDTRHLASWAAAKLGIPHVWASILGFDAQLSVFHAGHGPIYEDLFPPPPPPGSVPSCSQAGVLGPVVGVMGSAMAMEALKIITGVGTPLIGKLGYYSSLDGTWEYIPVVGSPEVLERVLGSAGVSGISGGFGEVLDVPRVSALVDGVSLIDVREPSEFSAYSIPGAHNTPLSAIREGAIPPAVSAGKEVIVYCAAGVRSAQAIAILESAGYTGMSSLDGGIEGWLDSLG
ncbi:molybdopterin biosynthesis protein MoeB [Corynebacterium glutamicum ATCC 14067]|uniref:ThiF family adenylyltransferase n=1 Tax=Corynebacterium glutamicum TaxID=1718 RepID=UPI000B92A360|nr:ThiF family adenylyltransferase [Corynebacterium glutamicum]AST19511.1 molybdopterin biosynthesis protein MoeB [Corynebacterium glutamicum ATCC 14067]